MFLSIRQVDALI